MSRSAVLAVVLAMAVVLFTAVFAYSIEECPDQENIPDGDRRIDRDDFNISVIYGHPLQFHDFDGDLLTQVQGMPGPEAIDYVIWGSYGLANRDNQFPNMIILAQLTSCDELFKLQQHYNDSAFKAYLVPYQSAVQNSHIGLLTKIDPDPSWLEELAIPGQWNRTSNCGALYQIPVSVNQNRLFILGSDLASQINQRSHCVVDSADLTRIYEPLREISQGTQSEILWVIDMNRYWELGSGDFDSARTTLMLSRTFRDQGGSFQLSLADEALWGDSRTRIERIKVSAGIDFLGPVLYSEGLESALEVIRRTLEEGHRPDTITSSALLIDVSNLLPIDIQTSTPQSPDWLILLGVMTLILLTLLTLFIVLFRRKPKPDSSRD